MNIIQSGNEDDDYISEKILTLIIDMEANANDSNYSIELIEFSPYETGYVQSYMKILNDYIKTFNNSNNLSVKIYVINKLYQLLYPNSEQTDQTQVIPFN